eukprot:NODE_10039_length_1381_cov_3.873206.p8 GENE.NODE_10039_length_1381_cov_3.873206~~NODE_10039_length_1381_cov_3.873206.p8  ORF type:complete len:63 (+),score=11.59 NODE_10039_length_1381_cov_3.873206:963-1151(+)
MLPSSLLLLSSALVNGMRWRNLLPISSTCLKHAQPSCMPSALPLLVERLMYCLHLPSPVASS